MKTSPEHDALLSAVLSSSTANELRAKSLDRALAAVRQRRRLRHALRAAGGVVTAGVMAAILWNRHAPDPQPVAAIHPPAVTSAVPTVPGTNIRVVSDEELLAMFPDRPVALVGPPGNRQFVFLDQKRTSQTHDAPRAKGHNL